MKSTLKINAEKFSKTVGDAVYSLAASSGNRRRIDSELNRATAEVVKKVIDHPISQEILGGPEVRNNPSGTLGGYGGLFSFIGFSADATPIADIVGVIDAEGFRIGGVRRAGNVTTMDIASPKMTEIWRNTPIPWQDGESWVRGVEEKGISGLGQYLNTRWDGRSGWGVQIKTKVRSQTRSSPQAYVAEIIKDSVKGIVNRITQDIIS